MRGSPRFTRLLHLASCSNLHTFFPPIFPQVFGHSAVSVALEIIRLRLVAFAFFRLPPAPVYIKMAFTIGWHGQLDRLFHPKKACRSPAVAVHSCELPNPSRGSFTSFHPQQARTRARKTASPRLHVDSRLSLQQPAPASFFYARIKPLHLKKLLAAAADPPANNHHRRQHSLSCHRIT